MPSYSSTMFSFPVMRQTWYSGNAFPGAHVNPGPQCASSLQKQSSVSVHLKGCVSVVSVVSVVLVDCQLCQLCGCQLCVSAVCRLYVPVVRCQLCAASLQKQSLVSAHLAVMRRLCVCVCVSCVSIVFSVVRCQLCASSRQKQSSVCQLCVYQLCVQCMRVCASFSCVGLLACSNP